ncbi:pheromone processing endoprotease, partial [Lunasporangiospora selenospora]
MKLLHEVCASVIVLLSATTLTTCQSDYTPNCDHSQRSYYLIRISNHNQSSEAESALSSGSFLESVAFPEDHQKDLGDLLGLRFESRVGGLQDYFLYSAIKTNVNGTHASSNRLSKRAKIPTSASTNYHYSPSNQHEAKIDNINDASYAATTILENDEVLQKFSRLRRQFSQTSQSSYKKKKRSFDPTAEIIQAVDSIQRQEPRQRIKKRVPVPEDEVNSITDPSKRKNSDEEEIESEEAEVEEEATDGDDEDKESEDAQVDEDKESEDTQVDEEESDEINGEYQPEGEAQPDDGIGSSIGIHDPGFRYQWHLHNTKDRHDINVTGVWEQGINGTGVNVAIIDDGLDVTSEDLAPNFFKDGSWDFNDRTNLPKPRLPDDQHGTRCAGEIAAAKNDLCGVGVAYGAKVSGLRILSGQITDVDEAAALNYRFHDNHIYSCSWGPPDDGKSMDAPKGVVFDAIVNGIKNGRSGLGSIFVFATGNGGKQDDDCNFDGYTNSLYTVSIGAIDRLGQHPYYSEACSAQLAVTYSNGGGSAIYTCDVGERQCFDQHGGTSAAAPIAAGMIALVLSIRSDLSWRDIQYLLMNTAVPVSVDDPGWDETAAGRPFNHKFGYGSLDAYALVEAAKDFQSLGPQTSFHPAVISVNHAIPQSTKGISSVLTVTESDLKNQDVELGTLEHITVTVNIEHQRRGDVEVTLTSPNGIVSHLGVRRRHDEATTGFVDWTFMSVKHWEEDPVGDWTLTVKDQRTAKYRGKFVDWRIKFWGERSKHFANIIAKPPAGPSLDADEVKDTEEVESDDRIKNGSSDKPVESTDDPAIQDQEDKVIGLNMSPPSSGSQYQEEEKGSADQNEPDQDSTDDLKEIKEANLESATELGASEVDGLRVGQTLYIICTLIGLTGMVVGYKIKQKLDSRGRYVRIQAGGLGGMGHEFDRGGDIGLLPRSLSPNLQRPRLSEESDGFLDQESSRKNRPTKNRRSQSLGAKTSPRLKRPVSERAYSRLGAGAEAALDD